MGLLDEESEYRKTVIGFIIFFMFAAIMTIIFIITPLDVIIQMNFFDPNQPAGSRFIYADNEPWKFLYFQEGAILFTYLLISLLLFIESRKSEKSRILALFAWFLLSVAIVGTGIVVNGIFKSYWGRPRPRETIPFGNDYPFYHVWYPAFWDTISTTQAPALIKDVLDNSSFSAGHPSEAIVFIAVFLILLKPEILLDALRSNEKNKRWALAFAALFSIGAIFSIFMIIQKYNKNNARILAATAGFALVFWIVYVLLKQNQKENQIRILNLAKYASLIVSIVGGIMMGLARAVQFGHWPSDSMWTFIFVYIIAFGLYFYVFRFHKENYQSIEEIKSKRKEIIRRFIMMLYPFVIIASVVWILEYMLLPSIFFPELIAAMILNITFPAIIVKIKNRAA